MKKGNRRWLSCLVSFIIAGAFAVSFYLVEGIYPGSENTILIYDELSQYTGIWEYSRYMFDNSTNFFYNWSLCLGGNNICQMAYYVGNPINLVVALFPIKALPEVVYFLTISKFSLAALSFSLYLTFSKRFKLSQLCTVLFSLSFSLMSYIIMYSMSLMWIDAVILLPIIILSLERLIDKGKETFFVIALVIVFYTNFYIAYMIVLFTFIYFVWYQIEEGKKIKDAFADLVRYSISGIIAALLAAPILLPVYKGLELGKGAENYTSKALFTANLLNILKKFFSCQYDSINANGTPSVYVGLSLLVLVFIYMLDIKRNIKTRLASLVVILIFILSMWIKPIDTVWHGFSRPVCFPGRYTFCFCFFIITIAAEGIQSYIRLIKKNRSIEICRIFNKYLVPLFFIYTIGELWLNGSHIIGALRIECGRTSRTSFELTVDNVDYLLSFIPSDDIKDYRIDGNITIGKDDSMIWGYKGLASFTSTYNNNVFKFCELLGIYQHDYVMSGDNAPAFARDILANKYIYLAYEPEIKSLKKIANCGVNSLYENTLCLPIGFEVSDDCLSATDCSEIIFENNNKIMTSMTGLEGVYSENSVVTDTISLDGYDRETEIVISNIKPGLLYLAFAGEDREERIARTKDIAKNWGPYNLLAVEDFADVYLENDYITSTSSNMNTPIYIGEFDDTQKSLVLRVKSNYNIGKVYAYSFDEDKHSKIIDCLKSNTVKPVCDDKAIYAGTLDCDDDSLYFFSIPSIPGIKCYVDNEEVESELLFDCFLGLKVSKGHHDIRITYETPGLKIGLVMSLVGALFYACYVVYENKKGRGENNA